RRRVAGRRARRVHRREDEERDEDVRERAGRDDGDPLPRRRAPVSVRARSLVDVAQRPLGAAPRARREPRVLHLQAQVVEPCARAVVVRRLERPPYPLHVRRQPRILADGGARERVDVASGGTVHPGDPDEAAERDHPDAVLDPVAAHLEERRREADVEAPRPHADRERDEEMAELVQEHEQEEADADDEPRHATGSLPPASERARASASTRSSRSRAGAPSTRSRTCSTSSAMPRNGSLPPRNASPARRARRSMGNVSRSGARNSSVSSVKSSCGSGVAARSGYVNAYEIGTRMSGYPTCARAAPSRKRTSEWTIDVGCKTTSMRS